MLALRPLLASNPFLDAYIQSDWLGKMIFLSLFALSIVSWTLILHKAHITYHARQRARHFHRLFEQQRSQPLNLDCDHLLKTKAFNPFLELYRGAKRRTIDILKKNRHYQQMQQQAIQESIPSLSTSDVEFIGTHLFMDVANQTKSLEKHLFILSMAVSLAPFLGLLGTVWGILVSFGELQNALGNAQTTVLGGISLALATTVLGLLDAIPALIGYSYLKHAVRDFQLDMEGFAHEMLAAIELSYRQVDAR